MDISEIEEISEIEKIPDDCFINILDMMNLNEIINLSKTSTTMKERVKFSIYNRFSREKNHSLKYYFFVLKIWKITKTLCRPRQNSFQRKIINPDERMIF